MITLRNFNYHFNTSVSTKSPCRYYKLSKTLILKRFYPGGKEIIKLSDIMGGNKALALVHPISYQNNPMILISIPRTTTVLCNPLIYSKPVATLQKITPFNYTNKFRLHQSNSQIDNKKVSKPPINFESLLKNEKKKKLQEIEDAKREFNTLITKSKEKGYIFESKIFEDTSINNLKIHELLFELYQRKLIKLDDKTATVLTAENGEKVIVGSYPYGVKMTQQGIALFKSLPSKQTLIDSHFDASYENPSFILIAIMPENSKTIIPSGSTTHINVVQKIRQEVCVYNDKEKVYKSIGYFTSQKDAELICKDGQFKSFQKNKEVSSKEETSQYFIAYDHSKIILPNHNIKILEGGAEYLSTKCNLNSIYKAIESQSKKPSELMNTNSFNIKDLEDIIQRFIYNQTNNLPQPKTDMQLLKEKEGKLKQKEKQMKTKLEKEKEQLPKNDTSTHESTIT